MKEIDKIDDVLNVLGITIGLAQIYTTLGIILLVLNIASILLRCVLSIYAKIKEKKYNEIPNELDKTANEIEEVLNNGKDK